MLPLIVTKDSRLPIFQYELLNKVLYPNKMPFRFGKLVHLFCSFCKMIEEISLNLFYNCTKTELLWNQLKYFISNKTLFFPSLTSQSAILGHIDISDYYLLINHLILIYKFYILTPETEAILTSSIWKQLLIKLKRLKKKLPNMNLKKDYEILWNGVLLLKTYFKQCYRGKGEVKVVFCIFFFIFFIFYFLLTFWYFLFFKWNQRKSSISVFQGIFTSADKIFISAAGLSTRQ